jgi:type IV pilus assembly protein PilB
MRYRIDGVLYEMMPPPAHIAPAISSRVKVMANLDIAERRMPQDGRIELSVNNQPIDLRVSVLPTMFGESVVMRVLDRGNVSLDLDKLGHARGRPENIPPADPQAQRHRARHRPHRLGQNHHALFRLARA